MVSIHQLKTQGLYRPQFEHDACGIGFITNIKGIPTHQMVLDGLEMLMKLDHRAGKDAEGTTGDGTGLLFQIPDAFFRRHLSFSLPEQGRYAVGMCFLQRNMQSRKSVLNKMKEIVEKDGLTFLGVRDVPVDENVLELESKKIMPDMVQIFVELPELMSETEMKCHLYRVRKRWEKAMGDALYVASFSEQTLVYKGMLTAAQIPAFFLDLTEESFATSLVMVHSRYSTNTFPSWKRAHPNRYIAHNGEINTVRGNANDFKAQLKQMADYPFLDGTLKDLFPIIEETGSDSQTFDAVLEFLLVTGRSLPEALMMMIPEPIEEEQHLSPTLKDFYIEQSRMMAPWDGPMAISFTNGLQIGAVLDRNGLRPGRYYLTVDDRIIFSSEAGVLDLPPEQVESRHHLLPGELLYIDLEKNEWVNSTAIKEKTAMLYKDSSERSHVTELPLKTRPHMLHASPCRYPSGFYQHMFGYTYEEVNKVLLPMAAEGKEPTGAMGVDTPLAVLSEQPKLLYDYFKQWFSQVTNPPIDAIREAFVISTAVWIGEEPSLLFISSGSAQQLRLASPVLTQKDLDRIENAPIQSKELDITIHLDEGSDRFEMKLNELIKQAETAIRHGASILKLTDHHAAPNRIALPALLVTSAIHHYLIHKGLRKKASLLVHTGEARDSHHMAMLLGFGADAIYPYLGYQTIHELVDQGHLPLTEQEAKHRYNEALVGGIVKIMSKVGISCIQSFKGAQTFEALGLSQSFLDAYFEGSISQLQGITLQEIESETVRRHESAVSAFQKGDTTLSSGSDLQWRKEGETHLFQPMAIHTLQQAARKNDSELYRKFTEYINNGPFTNIRSLLNVTSDAEAIPLDEVESVESLFKRFKTGAMSYGALSQEAHEVLAIAMNRMGGKSNSGEGGESDHRYQKEQNGDWKRSAIKQVASGRFGVTSRYLSQAEEIQIKMAQGAKPGEGGQLPGNKVYPWIAKVRSSTPGVGLISPPPHHDIYSIEDLAQLIYDLKQANPVARISVKLVAKAGVGTIAAGVAKGMADVILISGYDGGTGASPVSSIKHAGLPWELGLAETHQTLLLNGLRDKVVLETDGKLLTGLDVIIAACLGAEEYGFSTAPLIAMGCVMMRACHLDTCPVGVATQNPELRKKFMGTPEHIVNYLTFIAQDIREHLASLGLRNIDELIGRSDLLSVKSDVKSHWKAKHLNLECLFLSDRSIQEVKSQSNSDPQKPYHFDEEKLLNNQSGSSASFSIHNTDRTVGTRLGYDLTKKHETADGCHVTNDFHFTGTAGQSFGAFIPKGLNLTLFGDANDYTGKGLSGGRLIIQPGKRWMHKDNQALIGNVALYGATSGRAFIRGRAGQRFAVRNSGAEAVVEGIGDHGCEYMTGGRVLILGDIGKNFAAGMSGGVAYLINKNLSIDRISEQVNQDMVTIQKVMDRKEQKELLQLIKEHYIFTGSTKAKNILSQWSTWSEWVIKVIPIEYENMQNLISAYMRNGLTEEQAALKAFQEKKSESAAMTERTAEKTI